MPVMQTAIHFVVEEMTSNLEWMPVYLPVTLSLTDSPVLAGLLAMGAANLSYPFSFACKGIPNNAAESTKRKLFENEQARYVSYLTRQQLMDKSTELMILPESEALRVRPKLTEFINRLPAHIEPSKVRVVFWFT